MAAGAAVVLAGMAGLQTRPVVAGVSGGSTGRSRGTGSQGAGHVSSGNSDHSICERMHAAGKYPGACCISLSVDTTKGLFVRGGGKDGGDRSVDNPGMAFNHIGIALWLGIGVPLLPASYVGLAVPASRRIEA